MIYTLTVLVALYWTWRFLRSAHIHLRPLPEPSLETPSYTLLIPQGELPPALIPMPESVVHSVEALPHTGWVLALGAGLDVNSSLVRRLAAACDAEFVSIPPQPNSTLMSQVREKFIRNHVDFCRVNAIDEPMGYGDLACCWFFIDPTDPRGRDAPLPAQIAQWRALQARPIEVRHACTEDGDSMVRQALGASSQPRCFETGRGRVIMPAPSLYLFLTVWPFLAVTSTELRAPAAIALGLCSRESYSVRFARWIRMAPMPPRLCL